MLYWHLQNSAFTFKYDNSLYKAFLVGCTNFSAYPHSMEIGSLQLLYSCLRKINKGMAINMCIFSTSKPIVLKVFDIHCRGSLQGKCTVVVKDIRKLVLQTNQIRCIKSGFSKRCHPCQNRQLKCLKVVDFFATFVGY